MKKKAFTALELIGVLIAIAILSTIGYYGYNTTWYNNQVDACESELRILSNGFQNFFIDYGAIVLPDDLNYQMAVKEVIEQLNMKYLDAHLDLIQISGNKRSFQAKTKYKKDPFGNPYIVLGYTYDGEGAESIPGLIIISSAGRNGVSELSNYKNGVYGDDIIAVIEPK